MDIYYLAWQSQMPGLFGVPVLMSCHKNTLNSDLYAFIWSQVQRLIAPVERTGGSSRRLELASNNNCISIQSFFSNIYQADMTTCLFLYSSLSGSSMYPFELKIVQKDGYVCSQCSWQK